MDTPRSSKTSRTILFFGSGRDTLETVRNALEDIEGFRVSAAPKGAGGIDRIRDDPPDLVIADLDVPALPGFTLVTRIRSLDPNIPIIIAGSDPLQGIGAIRSGADDFLVKPLDAAEIAERVPAVLAAKEAGSGGDHSNTVLAELEREKREISNLLKISSSLDVSGDSKEMLKHLADLAAESMNCEGASIMLINRREKALEFVVATGEKGLRLDTITVPLGEGIAGWVAVHGKPQIVNDTRKDERFTGKVDRESGFITRQILAVPMRLEGEIIGVIEVINTRDNRVLGDHDLQVLDDISERVGMVIEIVRKIESQQNFFIQVTNILVRAIERKDMFSEGHSWMVAEICHKIANAMSLPDSDRNDLHFGSLLHDIGKLDMPSLLFNKRTLTERERELLRQHPVKGAKLIEPIAIWHTIVPCVLYHHESWDGSGYPFGRLGDSIPLDARIITLAEAFTVMRSSNSYKRQLSLKEAVLEMMRCAGKQFDPGIVRAFIGVLEQEAARH
jgi:response regulator RpfG family c-di-GMP phosphodiesterase